MSVLRIYALFILLNGSIQQYWFKYNFFLQKIPRFHDSIVCVADTGNNWEEALVESRSVGALSTLLPLSFFPFRELEYEFAQFLPYKILECEKIMIIPNRPFTSCVMLVIEARLFI